MIASSPLDDLVAGFQLEGAPVRGRYARLGAGTIDPILNRHVYPRPVALLLGEALTLAALIGALFNLDGRLVLEAEGEGPVSLLMAEYRAGGALRGYARLRDGAGEGLAGRNSMPPAELLGAGALIMTLDLGPGAQAHQGMVALEGPTLSACAEAYFERSVQAPTRILAAVAEEYQAGSRAAWRSGGALIQRVAGDDARGETDEDWEKARHLFATLTSAELVDPALPVDRALFRLFHEDGVRMAPPAPLEDRCTCDRDRLTVLLQRFGPGERADLIEPDGLIHAKCQFCGRVYLIAQEDLEEGNSE